MRGERHSHGHRLERLGEQIREEVSQIVAYELEDERIGLATVTDARVAPDMASVRVYVSVAGGTEEQAGSLAALNHAAGYVRRLLAPRLRIKRAPTVSFALDESLQRGNRIEQLLKENDG
jgi:ribosome-binding factor A